MEEECLIPSAEAVLVVQVGPLARVLALMAGRVVQLLCSDLLGPLAVVLAGRMVLALLVVSPILRPGVPVVDQQMEARLVSPMAQIQLVRITAATAATMQQARAAGQAASTPFLAPSLVALALVPVVMVAAGAAARPWRIKLAPRPAVMQQAAGQAVQGRTGIARMAQAGERVLMDL